MVLRLKEESKKKKKRGFMGIFGGSIFLKTKEYCKSVRILMSTKVVLHFGHYNI